jgi:nitrogen fixation/metabolism regulation signal transduction histidine kinase
MAFERVFSGSFLAGVLWRTLLVALLLTALLQLLFHTQYYATALVVLICILLTTADLIRLTASESRAAERFLDALSASALETPVQRSAVPASLRAAFDQTLARLREDRHRHQLRDQYLQTLLDTVPASLIVLHNDGHISFVNRAAHRLLGEPASRLADLSWLGEEASRQLTALTAGTHRIVQLSSGNRLLASAAQFATPDAPPRRLIALQRLSGDLDAVELTAWDQMARVLAHEMMNSLTPIASLSQSLDGLVRAGDRTADVTAALEAITRRSQGLLRFVERYRRIADLPEPHLQLEPLLPLVESVGRLVQPALEARAIALDISVAPQDLAAPLDRELLEQALLNLLRNAADAAADRPQPRIGVECRLHGGQCVIDVIDNGPGLTPEQREQLFVPFFTTKPGGSGIGLSLARRIAQGHGGQLVLLDAAQGGCVFRLSLRIARSAEPVVAQA